MWRQKKRVILGCIAAVVVSGGLYAVWSLFLNDRQSTYEGHRQSVFSVDVDETSQLVASAGYDGMRVSRLRDGQEVFRRMSPTHSVRFMSDNRLLCADIRKGLVVIDTRSWTVVKTAGHPAKWIIAAVSPCRRWVAASFEDDPHNLADRQKSEIVLLNAADLTTAAIIPSENFAHVVAFEFDPSGNKLVAVGTGGAFAVIEGFDDEVSARYFSAAIRPRKSLSLFTDLPQSAAAFTTNGELYVGTVRRDIVSMIHPKDTRLNAEGESIDHFVAAASPDGRWLATGGSHGEVFLWNAKSQRLVKKFEAQVDRSAILGLRFSPNSNFLVSSGLGRTGWDRTFWQFLRGTDHAVKVWRLP